MTNQLLLAARAHNKAFRGFLHDLASQIHILQFCSNALNRPDLPNDLRRYVDKLISSSQTSAEQLQRMRKLQKSFADGDLLDFLESLDLWLDWYAQSRYKVDIKLNRPKGGADSTMKLPSLEVFAAVLAMLVHDLSMAMSASADGHEQWLAIEATVLEQGLRFDLQRRGSSSFGDTDVSAVRQEELQKLVTEACGNSQFHRDALGKLIKIEIYLPITP